MKGIYAMLVALIYSGSCIAQPMRLPNASSQPVTITISRTIDDNYSFKRLNVVFDYDGSMGDTLSFGATAVTDASVFGAGFRPSEIRKGKYAYSLLIDRPSFIDSKEANSQSIKFEFYQPDEPVRFTMDVQYELNWKSLENFFGLQYSKATQDYPTISKVNIAERLRSTPAILKALTSAGVAFEKFDLIDDREIFFEKDVELRFSEGTNLADFKRILDALQQAGVAVTSVGFDQSSDKNYSFGRLVIRHKIPVFGQVGLTDAIRTQFDTVKDMAGVYSALGLQIQSPGAFLADVVEKARLLNIDCSIQQTCKQAYDTARYVLEQDPDNAKAPIEVAAAALELYDRGGAITEGMAFIDKALKKHPVDPDLLSWKGFLLYTDDSPQEAEGYFIKAKAGFKMPSAFFLREHAKNLVALGNVGDAVKLYQELMNSKFSHPDDVRGQYEGLGEYLELLLASDNPDAGKVYEKLVSDFPGRSVCDKPAYARYLMTRSTDTTKPREVMADPNISCEHAAPVRRLLLVADWSESNAGDKAAIIRLLKDFGDVATGISEVSHMAMGEKVIRQIAELGIDLNQTGGLGMSALHLVTAAGDTRAAALLLANSAKVDVESIDGSTPLIIAVAKQQQPMVQLLLQYKANPGLKNREGVSALEIAARMGGKEVIAMLKAHQPSI